MARVLHLLPSTALRLSIQDTETLLEIIGLRQPIDQLNYANADTASLSALLGGRQNADMLVQCLSESTDQLHIYCSSNELMTNIQIYGCDFTHT